MEVLASIFILTGGLLALIAALGLQRFRDVFARMHSATKPATMGLALILIGTALVMPGPGPVAKVLLVFILQFITAPVGAHLIGRATFRAGTDLDPATHFDELSSRVEPRD